MKSVNTNERLASSTTQKSLYEMNNFHAVLYRKGGYISLHCWRGPVNRKRSWLYGEECDGETALRNILLSSLFVKITTFAWEVPSPLSGPILCIRKLCKWDPRSSLLWLPDCFSLHTAMMMASVSALLLATPLVIYLLLSKTFACLRHSLPPSLSQLSHQQSDLTDPPPLALHSLVPPPGPRPNCTRIPS